VGYINALTYGKFDYFNIGNPRPEISVRRLAGIYQKEGTKSLGYSGKICFKKSSDKKYLTDNPNRRCPDISKARKLLKYNPKVSINDGVRRYLEFLKEEQGKS